MVSHIDHTIAATHPKAKHSCLTMIGLSGDWVKSRLSRISSIYASTETGMQYNPALDCQGNIYYSMNFILKTSKNLLGSENLWVEDILQLAFYVCYSYYCCVICPLFLCIVKNINLTKRSILSSCMQLIHSLNNIFISTQSRIAASLRVRLVLLLHLGRCTPC